MGKLDLGWVEGWEVWDGNWNLQSPNKGKLGNGVYMKVGRGIRIGYGVVLRNQRWGWGPGAHVKGVGPTEVNRGEGHTWRD